MLGCWRVSTSLALALTKHALLAAIEKPAQEPALQATMLAAVVNLSSYTHGMENYMNNLKYKQRMIAGCISHTGEGRGSLLQVPTCVGGGFHSC